MPSRARALHEARAVTTHARTRDDAMSHHTVIITTTITTTTTTTTTVGNFIAAGSAKRGMDSNSGRGKVGDELVDAHCAPGSPTDSYARRLLPIREGRICKSRGSTEVRPRQILISRGESLPGKGETPHFLDPGFLVVKILTAWVGHAPCPCTRQASKAILHYTILFLI